VSIHTLKRVQETYGAGEILWRNLESCTEFVLTHPNGWEGAQQSQMRAAAVKAGLISDDEAGHSRLSLVSEGEASLHFCIENALVNDSLKVDCLSCWTEEGTQHVSRRAVKDF
jgi:hypothetical protein